MLWLRRCLKVPKISTILILACDLLLKQSGKIRDELSPTLTTIACWVAIEVCLGWVDHQDVIPPIKWNCNATTMGLHPAAFTVKAGPESFALSITTHGATRDWLLNVGRSIEVGVLELVLDMTRALLILTVLMGLRTLNHLIAHRNILSRVIDNSELYRPLNAIEKTRHAANILIDRSRARVRRTQCL